MNDLKKPEPEIAGNNKDTQRIQQKPKKQLSRTGKPVFGDEHEIDFTRTVTCNCERNRTLPGSRACEKDRKSSSSRITSCRLATEQRVQPIRQNSKAMIRELELFELCETTPKVQCSHCLPYWNQGIAYCTCGHLLIQSDSRRNCNKLKLDALSIPNNVIKKEPTHDARHDKNEEQKKYHVTWNAWKRGRRRLSKWTFYKYSRSISQTSSLL